MSDLCGECGRPFRPSEFRIVKQVGYPEVSERGKVFHSACMSRRVLEFRIKRDLTRYAEEHEDDWQVFSQGLTKQAVRPVVSGRWR